MAEDYNDISGYVYTMNNPINIIDLDGMDTIDVKNLDWPNFDPNKDVVNLEPATIIEFSRKKIDYDRGDSWLYEAMPNNLFKGTYRFMLGNPYEPMIIGFPPISGKFKGIEGGKKIIEKISGKNEKHGDSGRAKTKVEKRIEELEKQKEGLPRKQREKIDRKIRNIKEDAERKAKGEEHSRGIKQ